MAADTPAISVIIPVWKNASTLRFTLEALAQQSYPGFEVILISNGTPEPAAIDSPSGLNLKRFHLPEAGSYRARNLGVRNARAKFLAFTDADCVPDYRWLEKGLNRLVQNPRCGLIAGQVLAKSESPQSGLELYQLSDFFPQEIFIKKCRFGATANLFTRQEVFETVGGFTEALYSAGDVEWGERVSQNFSLLYADEVRVFHPLRQGFREVYLKEKRCAGGLAQRKKIGISWQKKLNFKWGHLFSRLGKIARYPEATLTQKLNAIAWLVFFQMVWTTERLRVALGGQALNT